MSAYPGKINSNNNDNNKNNESNSFKFYNKLKSIKFLFISVIMFFLFILILSVFFSNFLVMNYLYDTINKNYLTQYIILPISYESENFTQILNMRIKTMEEIIMESKLINIKLMTEFVFLNDIQFNTQEVILSNYNNSQVVHSKNIKDFYINLLIDPNKQSINKTEFLYNKFKSLSYFLIFFQQSYYIPFNIEEIMIIDPLNMNYLVYSDNFKQYEDIIVDLINKESVGENNLSIESNLEKYGYADYIIENIYSAENNYFNYLKIHKTNITINNENYTFYFIFRLSHYELTKVFNSIGNNSTIIFKRQEAIFNFLPVSVYMENFFSFLIDGDIININSITDSTQKAKLPYSSHVQVYNQYIFNFTNYFQIMNYADTNGKFNISDKHFNNYLYSELNIMSGLFHKILIEDFNINFLSMGSGLNYEKCMKSVMLSYSNMTCDIINFNETKTLYNLNFANKIQNNNTENISQSDNLFQASVERKFQNARFYEQNQIFESFQPTTSIDNFEKKFIISNNIFNNMNITCIEMLDLEKYYIIENNFILNMQTYSSVIFGLLIIFSVIVFSISLIITIKSVDSLLSRIKSIRNLKSHLFYKEESLHMSIISDKNNNSIYKSDEIKIKKVLESLVKRCNNNEINEQEKIKILEKDSFDKQLIIILCESKKKLLKILRKVDNETEPDFLNKIKLIKRRYRLCKLLFNILVANNGFSKYYDFKDSSLLFKEIKNLNIFKLEDISYNIYYNHCFVNGFFKNLYRILDHVDDGIILLDNNLKFLKFEEIVKFVFHIKRRLINPLVSDIFNPLKNDVNKFEFNDIK